LGFISFTGTDLLKWGANYRPLIDNKEYWRLLTSTFLHGGVLHVLFNMYGLLFVGIFLEPVLGSSRYLMAYLITGLAGSIASVWWHVATVSVGASGAIFGMYGVFFALLTVNLFPAGLKKSFLISTSVFIVFNLVNGLTGGIDNAAHIGGLASGLLLGYMFYPSLKDKVHQATAEAETQQMLDELSSKSKKDLSE
jgi:rhomboid protease GluP